MGIRRSRLHDRFRRPPSWAAWVCLAGIAALTLASQLQAADRSAPALQTEPPASSQPIPFCEEQPLPAAQPTEQVPPPEADAIVPIEGDLLTIDLQTAWRLAGVQNPTINAARMAITESEALQRQAALIWFPNLNAGTFYHRHVGALISSGGQVRNLSAESVYFGGGARTVAAESNGIPMVQFIIPIADALFNPLAARQQTAVTRYNSTATNNNILLDTTLAYLDLAAAETQVEAFRLSQANVQQVVDTTAAYAKAGQGRAGDANRAASEGFLVEVDAQGAQETLAVSSAELARLLHLDPSTRLKTPGGPLRTFDLVDLDRPMSDLIETALRYRPELAARNMAIAQSRTRVRQEQTRPLLPLVTAGYSAGDTGGTGNFSPVTLPNVPASAFTGVYGRTDLDVMAVWTLQNMGAGNIAQANRRRAQMNQSIFDRTRMINQVRLEVTEAYGLSLGERNQVRISLRRLAEAEAAFREDFQRLRAFEGLPIEVLNSARLLVAARSSLIEAFIGDNEAQFRLFVAMGQPPYRAVDQLTAQTAPQSEVPQP